MKATLKRPLASDGSDTRAPKIFVATPAYGGLVTTDYAMGLQHLIRSLDRSGLEFQLALMAKESLITRARNNLVAQFRKTDCTHLLFLDADIGFSASDVATLVQANVDVVCGAYPLKRFAWEGIRKGARADAKDLELEGACYAANAMPRGSNGAEIEVMERGGNRYIELMDAATGFLLVTRDAIERYIRYFGSLIEYTSDYEPQGEIHHRVFDAGEDPESPRQRAMEMLRLAAIEGSDDNIRAAIKATQEAEHAAPGRYLSEDYWFSRRWQQMGGKVWLSLGCRLTHTGPWIFKGDISHLVELKPVADAKGEAAAE